jgi:hypothetical protein
VTDLTFILRWLTCLGVGALAMTAAASQAAPTGSQRAFATPQEAVQATMPAPCMVSLIARGYEQGVPGGRRVLSAM